MGSVGLAALVLWALGLQAAAEVLTVSRCYEEGIVPLQCPSGSMIRVFNVTYGRSEAGLCARTPGDCALTEETSFGCNGRTSCLISITGTTKYFTALPRCGLLGNYLEVKFECVPVSEVKDICREKRTEVGETGGYVSSPHFTGGYYSAYNNCPYKIIGSDIRLHIITVNLTDMHDCLIIENAFSTKTFCGGSGIIENYDVTMVGSTELDVTFMSSRAGHNGGIWLYYSMTPLPVEVVKTTTTLPTTTSTAVVPPNLQTIAGTRRLTTRRRERTTPASLPPAPETWTLRVPPQARDDRITVYNNISTAVSMETVALILSVVFGILGTAVISLFIVYFLKRYKDYKQKKLRRRSDSSTEPSVAWHNATNECLSSILEKGPPLPHTEQCYVNNMSDSERCNAVISKYKLENSFC